MPRRSRARANVIASRLKAFVYFSSNLGPDTFSKFKNVRGSWSSTGAGQATAADTAYPISSVKAASSNVDISMWMPGAGTGIAFWVTDANNWWALITEQTRDDMGTYCTGYYQSSGSGCGCYTYYYTYYSSYSYSCVTGQYCSPNYGYCVNRYGVCYGQNGPYQGSGQTCPSPCYACGGYATEYMYYRKWSIIKSVNNAVTSIVTQTIDAISSKVGTRDSRFYGALKLFIRGATTSTPTLTAKLIQQNTDPVDIAVNGQTTQIGVNLVHNPTGMTVTNTFGIIASPSAYNEDSTAQGFTISTTNLDSSV